MKIKRIYISVLIVTLLLFDLSCFAYQNKSHSYLVTELSAKDGLSQNDVRAIVQDSDGYIWFGTNDGLNRYDGYEFKTYRIGDRGLESNLIRSIGEGPDGNLWLGTEDNGLIFFNKKIETFTKVSDNINVNILLPKEVNNVVTDKYGNAWISADSRSVYRFRYSPNNNIFEFEQIELPINERSRSMTTDDEGNMVMITYKGVYRYLSEVGFIPFCSISNIINIQWKNKRVFMQIGTFAYEYNQESKQTTLLNDIAISKMLVSSENKLWVANQSGIYCINLNSKDSNNTIEITTMPPIVTFITEDSFGNIWFGSYRRGVLLVHEKYPFQTFRTSSSVESLLVDSYGQLWAGEVSGKILRFGDPNTENLKEHIFPESNTLVHYMLEHKSSKRIYVSTDTGITYFDVKQNTDKSSYPKIPITNSYHMSEDGQYLWVSTFWNGLQLLNTETNKVENTIMASSQGLPSNTVRFTMLDQDSNLWVSTQQGLIVISAESRFKPIPEFKRVIFRNNCKNVLNSFYVLPIYKTEKGDIWVGTLGMGLYRLSNIDEDFRCDAKLFTTENGLSNNIIRGLLEDGDNKMWVSTTSGLNSINMHGQIRSFSKNDGLQDYEFRDLSCAVTQSGFLAFGGLSGFNFFDPTKIIENQTKPLLVITDFQVNNQSLKVNEEIGSQIILKEPLANGSKVKLKHNQNSFTFSFSALHYKVPKSSQYAYQLKGYDEDWIETSSSYRMAKYSNLPPGNYLFRVKGSNNGDTWSDVTEISITVMVPLWETWYAYIFYLLLIILLIIMSFRNITRRQRHKTEMEMAKREKQYLQELHESKITFFTNLSHEFRTPLTLILSPLQRLLADKRMESYQRISLLNAIKQNSNILLQLVNQTMDFLKYDKNKFELLLERSDIVLFIKNIAERFNYLAADKEISLTFSSETESIDVDFDKEHLEKVFYNLLSNAIKHTPYRGNVSCMVKESSNSVEINVIDSGVGIDPTIKDHLFKRFYSVKSNYSDVKSTGVGLSLAKKLIDMHNGEISCQSNPGKGATFKIILPKAIYPINLNYQSMENKGQSEDLMHDFKIGYTKDVTVLIVDDNHDIVTLLQNLLSNYYKVIVAYDGQQGLALSIKHMPALIVSDIMMPNMDGIEMCKAIKQDPLISHIPVLMLTAKVTAEAKHLGYAALADAYYSKPFDNDVLLSMINSIIINRKNITEKFKQEFIQNSANIKISTLNNDFLKKIIDIVDENLSNENLNISFLVGKLGVNSAALNKKLKDITGQTTNSFIRSIKLKRAAEMLATNQYTVQEVTYATGFNDLRHFRECFRKEFNMNPSEYVDNVKIKL